MAEIEKRGNSQWRVRFRRRGHPEISKTFFSRPAAEAWARKVEHELETGAWLDSREAERMTFADLAKRFRGEFAPQHYRGRGWEYKLRHLEARLSKRALAAITPTVVAEYRDARLKDPDPRFADAEKAPRVSGATVKTELDLLSRIFTLAEKGFNITLPRGNPVDRVLRPKDGAGRELRVPPGSDAETRLLAACDADSNALLGTAVRFAVETSMRQGEMLGLIWDDVLLERRVAILRTTKNGGSRAVPLTTKAVLLLQGLSRKGDELRVFAGFGHSTTLQHAFRRACLAAGIHDLRWHDLRHEALSRLAERGDLSVFEIAAISGHNSLQTLKRYTHFQAEKLAHKLDAPRGGRDADKDDDKQR